MTTRRQTATRRRLSDAARSKALVNEAWEQVRRTHGSPPPWNYIACVAIVDAILHERQMDDGRDLSDALVLCLERDVTPTKAEVLESMRRVDRARQGTAGYR